MRLRLTSGHTPKFLAAMLTGLSSRQDLQHERGPKGTPSALAA